MAGRSAEKRIAAYNMFGQAGEEREREVAELKATWAQLQAWLKYAPAGLKERKRERRLLLRLINAITQPYKAWKVGPVEELEKVEVSDVGPLPEYSQLRAWAEAELARMRVRRSAVLERLEGGDDVHMAPWFALQFDSGENYWHSALTRGEQ